MTQGITIGWKLDGTERAALLRRIAPTWPDIVADHVTLHSRKAGRTELPPSTRGSIVGVADDGAGVQALVVRIDGTTERPDGGTYHVTWSIDRARGRTPVESNDVIARRGWTEHEPIAVTLLPARL